MKRSLVIIIHIFAALLAMAGLSVLYISSPSGYGLSWTAKERYEDTPQFSQKLNTDIARLRQYARLRDTFEENGELNMDGVAADMETDGAYASLTLREAIQTAQKFGCYLDPNTHELSISAADQASEKEGNYEVKVNYKYYDPDYFNTIPLGPGAGVTTIRELSIEVMRNLARYYKLREQYIETPGNLYFELHYMNAYGEYVDLANTNKSAEELLTLGKYVYVRGDEQKTESNVEPIPENALRIETEFDPNEQDEEYLFAVAVDTDYPYADSYQRAARHFEGDIRLAYAAVGMLALGLILCAASFVMIVRFDGYRDREEALSLRPADRLPLEIYLLLGFLAAVFGCLLMSMTGLKAARVLAPQEQWNYWKKLLNWAVVYAVSVYMLLGLIRRAKNGGLLRNSLMHGLIADLNRYAADKSVAGGLFARYSLLLGGNLLMFLALIWLYLHRAEEAAYLPAFAAGLMLLISADLYIFKRLYRRAKEQDSLRVVIDRLSEGNTDCEIETEAYSGRERETAEKLSHISVGMREALSEQVRSERLKADLITNVSHDIRTPLTSIINYVDLLRRQDIQNEKVREYIEVLVQKSARLKNLTEDLLEASKASSGNIKLDLQTIDLVELTMQAGAELSDKFSARKLELCLSAPDHAVLIRADGRHLWRVLENLYNNAAKYSMEQTRVYADVAEDGEQAVFTIKNVSAVKLNISPDELTERFVRGDVSRTTDGSGLGLSIAKSLTALQGGSLSIFIDGDLYKAQVIFPLVHREECGKRKDLGQHAPETEQEEKPDKKLDKKTGGDACASDM